MSLEHEEFDPYGYDMDIRSSLPLDERGYRDISDKKATQQLSRDSFELFKTLSSFSAEAKDPFVGQYFEGSRRSKYDYRLGEEHLEDLNEVRAKRQSTADKWGNATAKMGITAATTFLDGTIGTVVGMGNMVLGGDFVANPFSLAMNQLQEWTETVMPNYYTKEEMERPWYTNLGTANFWADKFLKNFGFTIGAVYSGMAWSGAAGALLSSPSVARNVGAGMVKQGLAKTPEHALKLLKTGKIKPEQLIAELAKDAKTLSRNSGIQSIVGSIAGATGEAKIEAIANTKEFEENMIAEHSMEWDRRLEDTTSKLKEELILSNPEFFDPLDESRLTQEGRRLLEARLFERKNKELETLRDIVDAHRNVSFGVNSAILSIGNYAQFRTAFGGGYGVQRNALANISRKTPEKGVLSELQRDVPKTILSKITDRTGKVLRTIQNPVWEGLEESFQEVTQEASDNFYGMKFNADGTETLQSYIEAWLGAAVEQFSDIDNYEEFFIGFLTGAIGVPTVVRGRTQMSGGIWSDYQQQRQKDKYTDQVVESYNKMITSDRFMNNYSAAVRTLAYEDVKNKSLDAGDIFNYKNAESSQFVSDMMLFEEAGRMDEAIEFFESMANMDVTELKQMFTPTKDKNGTPIAAENQRSLFDGMTDTEIKSYITERSRNLVKQAKDIRDMKKNLDIKLGDTVSPSVKQEVLHYMATIKNVESRLEALKAELPTEISMAATALLEDYITNDSKLSSEDFLKAMEEAEKAHYKKNPTEKEEVQAKIQDFLQLMQRRMNFVDMYNDVMSTGGMQKLQEYHLNLLENAVKFSENIKENAAVLNETKKAANKELGDIFQATNQRESLVTGDTELTLEHKGVLALDLELANPVEGKTSETRYFHVDGVDGNTGELHLTELKMAGSTYATDKAGNPIRANVKTKMGADGTIADGRYSVWTNYNIETSAESVRLNSSRAALRQALVSEVNRDIKQTSVNIEALRKVAAAISADLKRAMRNKSKTVVHKVDPNIVKTTIKVTDRQDIQANAKIVMNVVQLKALQQTINQRLQENQERLEQLEAKVPQIESIVKKFDPKSYTRVEEGELVISIQSTILESIENTKQELQDLIDLRNELDTLIKRLNSYTKGLVTRVMNLMHEQRDLTKYLDQLQAAVQEGDVADISYLDAERLYEIENIIQNIEEKLSPEAKEKIIFTEQQIKTIDANIQQLKSKLGRLQKSAHEGIEIYDKFLKEYSKLFSPVQETPAGESVVSNKDIESSIRQAADTFIFEAPMEPFNNNIGAFMRTTAAQDKFIESYNKGENTFEPQLLFQNFIDSYDTTTNEKSKDYKSMKAYSSIKMMEDSGIELTPSQKEDLGNVFELYEGVVAVIVNKDGSPMLVESTLDKGRKTVMYATINGVNKDEGVPINQRHNSNKPVVSLTKYAEKNSEEKATQDFITKALEYENLVIKKARESKTPLNLTIVGKTSGMLNVADQATPVVGNLVAKESDLKGLNIIIPVGTQVSTKQGESYDVTPGFVYFEHLGRLIKANRQNLDAVDISKTIELLQLAMTKETAGDTTDIIRAINSITYMLFEKKGRESQGSPYRFYIKTDGRLGKTGAKATVTGVVFGDKFISKDELLNPVENADTINELTQFLESKYYNVDSKLLKDANSNKPFTSFKASLKSKKGAVTSGELVIDREYTKQEGGYKSYLLSGEKGNVPKLMTITVPQQSSTVDKIQQPQMKNRAFKFDVEGVTQDKINNVVSDKQLEKAEQVSEEDAEKPTLKGDSPGAIERAKEKFAKLREEGKLKRTFESKESTEEAESKPKVEVADEVDNISSEEYTAFDALQEEEITQLMKENNWSREDAENFLQGGINKISTKQGKKSTLSEIQSDIEVFKKILPDTTFEIVENNIAEGLDAQFRATKDSAMILVSQNSDKMSVAHEVWHEVSFLFTRPEERTALYQEVRDVLGNTTVKVQDGDKFVEVKANELTDAQAEEFLGEEFRSFVLVGRDNYKFGKSNIKRNIFQRIWDAIVDLVLGKNASMNTLYRKDPQALLDKFEEIMSSEYRLTDRVDRSDIVLNKIGDFSASLSNDLVRNLNYNFFEKFELMKGDYTNLNEMADQIYKGLKILYTRAAQKSPQHKKLLNSWDELVKSHTKYLRQYGLLVDPAAVIDQDSKLSKDNAQMIESNLVNFREAIPSGVKLLIAGLPQFVIDTRTSKVAYKTKYGMNMTVDYAKTVGILSKELANLNSFEEMVQRMKELGESRYPEFLELIKRLGISEDLTIPDNISEDKMYLIENFFNIMHKSQNHYITGVAAENSIYMINNLENTNESRILDKWKNNARLGKGKLAGLLTRSGGKVYINTDHKFTIKDYTTNLKTFSVTELKKHIPKAEDRISIYRNLLSEFGITLDMKVSDGKVLADSVTFLLKEINDREALNKKTGVTEKVTIDNIFDRSVIKVNKELKQLINLELKAGDNFVDNQHINSNGQYEFSIMQKHRIGKVIDALNKGVIPQEFIPFDPKTGVGNIQTIHTRLLDHIEGTPNSINKAILRDFGMEVDDKVESNNLKLGDLTTFEFNSVLKGIMPVLRASDRKLEYALDLGEDYVRKDVTKQVFAVELKRYLRNEIIAALAMRGNPEFSRFVKANNSKGLTIFESIVPQIDKIIKTGELDSSDPTDWFENADRLMKEQDKTISNAINSYVDKLTATTFNALKENRLVEETISKDKRAFVNLGISPELSKKFTEGTDILSEEQLAKLIMTFNYHYITNAIDQTKLMTGDPSIYQKGQENDFHKRTTTFLSTISGTLNDASYINYLNNRHPRLDSVFGFEHTDIYRDFVFADTKVKSQYSALYSKVLGNTLGKAYENMTEDDARGLSTLDGYKSFSKRTGIWTDAHEQTWQYESQILMTELINRERLTDVQYAKIFKEHLPSDFQIGKYYFKGKEIVQQKLQPLPPLKPQGTGLIRNAELISANRTQITKTAVMPMLPSEILANSPDMFNAMVDFMENGIDFVFPESAKKGDIVGGTDGKLAPFYSKDGGINKISDLVNQGYAAEEISWNDIGNQLDIDPSGKSSVTQSTQKRRLVFIDMFENGKLKSEFEGYEADIKQYNALHSELINRGIDRVLDMLGIEEGSTEGAYKLSNNDKFKDTLIAEFSKREMPDNVVEAIDIVLSSSLKVFDTLPTKRQIANVLQGLLRNNAITLKVTGDMLVQDASTGYESQSRTNVQASNFLKFYRPVDANGKEVTDMRKAVSIAPAEAMMSLPKSWIPYVENNFQGKNFAEKLQKFNEFMLTDTEFQRINTYSSNRVPGQHRNSLEVLKIIKFTSPTAGSKIILPTEIVVKSGSDFDIDKLTAYFNAVYFDKKTGKPTYIDFKDDSNSGVADRYASRHMKFRKLEGLIDKISDQEFQKFQDAVSKENGMIDAISNVFNSDPLFIDKTEYFEDSEVQQILDEKGIKLDIEKIRKLAAQEAETSPTLEEFKKLSIEQQNSTKAIENRINEIDMRATLDVNNFKSLIKPNNSDIIKTQAFKVFKETDLDNVPISRLLEFDYNMKKGVFYWGATTLVGAGAVNTVSHAMTQQNPIRIESPMIVVGFGKKVLDSGLYLGHTLDQKDNNISDNNTAVLTGAVDAGKESFPSIFKINMTMSTANAYFILNRLGSESQRPVGFETLTEFFTQPIITEYERLSRINEAKFLQVKEENLSKNQIIGTLIKSRKLESRFAQPTYKMLHELFSDYIKAEKDIQRENAQTLFMSRLKSLGAMENFDNQEKVLEYFLYYQELGKLIGDLNSVTRQDAGLPKDRITIKVKQKKLQRLLDTGIFDRQSIDNFFDNSFIGTFKDSHDKTLNMFNDFWVSSTPGINEFIWGDNGIADMYLNPKLNKPEDDVVRAIQKIENATLAHILHTTPVNKVKLNSRYKELMQGENSLPKRLEAARMASPSNVFLQETVSIIKEYVPRRNSNSEVDYVKFTNRKFTVEESNSVTESVRELLESGNDEYVQLGKDLLEFAIMQSGIQMSHTSFFELLPAEAYHAVASGIMEKYLNSQNIAVTEGMKDEVFANLAFDSNIVPRQRYSKPGETIEIKPISQNSNYDYLAVNERKVSKTEADKIKRLGGKIPYQLLLYKQVKDQDGNPKILNEKIIYERINNRGDSFRFFEAHGDIKVESIISSNNFKTEGNVSDNSVKTSDKLGSKAIPKTKTTSTSKPQTGAPGLLNLSDAELLARMPGEADASNFMQLENVTNLEPDAATNESVTNFLNKIGVTYKPVDQIYNRMGEIVGDSKSGAVAVASLSDMTVSVIEGRMDRSTLPEEAAHFYVELLPKTDVLFKSMMAKITDYDIYSKTVERYKDIYLDQDGNPDIFKIRKEAVGKLIALEMIGETQDKQSTNWFRGLWNKIKSMFSRTNPFKIAAFDIMKGNIERLTKEIQPEVSEEFYQSDINNKMGMMLDDNTRSRREAAERQLEMDRYWAEVEATKREASEEIAKENESEFSKVSPEIKNVRDEIFANFDKYYPHYAESMSTEEIVAFVEQLSEGEISTMC
jgi:hypothetical protein